MYSKSTGKNKELSYISLAMKGLQVYGTIVYQYFLRSYEGMAHMCVLLKKSETEFTVYDPNVLRTINTENSQSCINILSKLAEVQKKEFLWFIKAVSKKSFLL